MSMYFMLLCDSKSRFVKSPALTRENLVGPQEKFGEVRKMTLELCLFRHGRTTWNEQGRYQGHADVDLDDLGRAQALAVAKRCVAMKPIALFSSDLKRCADVAVEVSNATGLPSSLDQRLRERDVGLWSGLTRVEIAERFPEEFALWTEGDETVCPGGGESAEHVVERIKSFVDTIRQYETGTVVAITHGGWIRSALLSAMGSPIARRSLGVPAQGSLTVFSIKHDEMTLEAYNDRGHLLSVEPVDQEPPAPRVY